MIKIEKLRTIPSNGAYLGTYARLVYALDRRRKGKFAYLWLSASTVREAGIVHKERCDIFWDEEDLTLIIRRPGKQRSISVSDGSARISVASYIDYCEIPVRRNDKLSVDIVEKDICIDFSPPPKPKWDRELKDRVWNIYREDESRGSKTVLRGVRLQPTMETMFRQVAQSEGKKLYSWAREALLRYVQDNHPEVYHNPEYWEEDKRRDV